MKVSSSVAILLGKANRLDELIRRGGVPKKDVNPSGSYAHAEGENTTASGQSSHAEGAGNTASGARAHAEGIGTRAAGNDAHAEGTGTVASGSTSHAEGVGATAAGYASHAEGQGAEARGPGSHAEGSGTVAASDSQHVQGRYNIEDASGTYAHIIGNGTRTERSNAHTVDWSGNAYYAGNIAAAGGNLTLRGTSLSDTQLAGLLTHEADKLASRIQSLDGTVITGEAIEAVGNPVYVDEVAGYSAYGITETGWYIFIRVTAKAEYEVTTETTITGADGYIATAGATHVDIAVRFGTAATSKRVTIRWADGYEDVAVIKATDLAVRNLDYMVTFYVYDADPFITYEWTPAENYTTGNGTFAAEKLYYTKDGDTYTRAEVTAGDTIPPGVYYTRKKAVISGLTRNVTYRLNEVVDFPIEFILPEIEDETHGAWFEIRFRHNGPFSITLTPPSGVKVATEHTQPVTGGINMVNLHYTVVDGLKIWRFMNTHSTIPSE